MSPHKLAKIVEDILIGLVMAVGPVAVFLIAIGPAAPWVWAMGAVSLALWVWVYWGNRKRGFGGWDRL